LDILRNVRTDCLVVVICAAHLIGRADDAAADEATRQKQRAKLKDAGNWTLDKVHELVDLNHRDGMTHAFFRALFYVTNHAGKIATATSAAPVRTAQTANGHNVELKSTDSAAEAVSSIYTVLVVLNDRDKTDDGKAQFA